MQSTFTSTKYFSSPSPQQLFSQRETNSSDVKPILDKPSRYSVARPKRLKCMKMNLDHRLILVLLICWLDLVSASRASFYFEKNRPATGTQLPNRGYNVHHSTEPKPKPTTSTLPVREVFQVHQPVLTPFGPIDQNVNSDAWPNVTYVENTHNSTYCIQSLMIYSFANSANQPFVGNYSPPSCKFDRVVLNFTVTVQGNQYDRLGLMWFGDTEIWRTSTAEPFLNETKWTYMKDVSEYLHLWNQPQKLIFDLGNVVNSIYTGIYNTSLTAIFFNGTNNNHAAPLIIPISARKSSANQGSLFALPAETAANTISFPQNANRAVFSVSVCGNADEEFWWTNNLSQNTSANPLPSFSPWREVQIYIDEQLVGVEWPFPIIFTGGVDPFLWSPIVGIDAFDLREHEIDITPWLPILCDGQKHTFEIKVAGLNDSGRSSITITKTVGSSWYVSGKIFIWLDSPSSITRGSVPIITAPQPNITLSTLADSNGALYSELVINRYLSISSTVKTQQGTSIETWTQLLTYSNNQTLADAQFNPTYIITSGNDASIGAYPYQSYYTYTSLLLAIEQWTNISRGLEIETFGNSIYPSGLEAFNGHEKVKNNNSLLSGWYLNTSQNASASSFTSATTAQELEFGSFDVQKALKLYSRNVEAVDGIIVKDKRMNINN